MGNIETAYEEIKQASKLDPANSRLRTIVQWFKGNLLNEKYDSIQLMMEGYH